MAGQTGGQTDGQTDRQTDKELGIGTNEDGPSCIDRASHIDDSIDLFDQFQYLPSRDADDDRFQRTLVVPTGLTMGAVV